MTSYVKSSPPAPSLALHCDYKKGVLSNGVSIAPDGGRDFGPRHLDFHPAKPWMYVSIETQSKMYTYKLESGRINPDIAFRAETLAKPTNRRSRQAPFKLDPPGPIGPRHYCFHPTLDLAYFSAEQGCSVTAYRVDRASGTLSVVGTTHSLPEGVTLRNTCSQIYLTPSGRFLYVGNRGHNSIAGFAVDPAGRLTPAGHGATEAVPTAFGLDSRGTFLYAAGTASGRLASCRQ